MGFLDRWLYGVDLDEEQARSDALDAQLRDLNRQDRDQYGDEWFAQAQRHVDEGAIPDVGNEVDQAFWEGWDEGAENIRGIVGKTAGAVIGTPFKIIPPSLLLLFAGLALFWFFGSPKFLKKT